MRVHEVCSHPRLLLAHAHSRCFGFRKNSRVAAAEVSPEKLSNCVGVGCTAYINMATTPVTVICTASLSKLCINVCRNVNCGILRNISQSQGHGNFSKSQELTIYIYYGIPCRMLETWIRLK